MPTPDATRQLATAAIRDPVEPHRLTIDWDSIGELADDIAANGLLQPPGVVLDETNEGGELVWGHRRLLAVRMLSWDVITCRVFPAGTDPLQARLSENHQREPLTPIEEAHIVRQCIERGESPESVMRRFRRSRAWVMERAALLDYPDDVRNALQQKRVPLGVCHELAGIDHEGYRKELIAEAERVGATRTTAAMWKAQYERDKPRVIANQITLDQLRQGRDEYVLMHQCPLCSKNNDITKTRLYRVCSACAEVIEQEIARAPSTADPTALETRGGPDGTPGGTPG